MIHADGRTDVRDGAVRHLTPVRKFLTSWEELWYKECLNQSAEIGQPCGMNEDAKSYRNMRGSSHLEEGDQGGRYVRVRWVFGAVWKVTSRRADCCVS